MCFAGSLQQRAHGSSLLAEALVLHGPGPFDTVTSTTVDSSQAFIKSAWLSNIVPEPVRFGCLRPPLALHQRCLTLSTKPPLVQLLVRRRWTSILNLSFYGMGDEYGRAVAAG